MNDIPDNRLRTLPMPSADRAFYDAVLAAGFAAFPERRENYARFRAAGRSEDIDYLPIRMDIENVSRCNFRCTMCQVSDWPKQIRAADMSFEDFRRLLESQHGLIEIKLQGMGEPLLAADDYIRMIEFARSRHLWVRSTVNGSLLHLKENYKRLIDSDICEIQISIDGASKETYEAIRRGGKFNRVTRNCKLLNDYARAAGRMRTRMWVVVQKGNQHELERFPVLAGELGFDRLTLSLDLNDWGQDSWRERNDPVDVHRRFDVGRARQLVEIGRSQGVETTFWFIDEKYVPGDKAKVCPWPFERAYISSDMRVVPCCMIANPEVSEFGDARDFNAVWFGEAMREFRRDHLAGRIPAICRTCYGAARVTTTTPAAKAIKASH